MKTADDYLNQGLDFQEKGEPDKAIESFEKAIETDPEFKLAYYCLGKLYRKNDHEKAIEYYRKAIEKDPNYPDAYNGWGNVLFDSGNNDEAIEKYKKCIEINPDFKWAYCNLGILYEKKDPEKAIEYYRKATEIDAYYTDAYNGWGNVLFALGNYDDAIGKYKKCIEIDPEFKLAYYNLGISFEKKDPEQALEYYKKVTEKDAYYTDAYNGWGNILLDLGKNEEARTKYEKCIEINPDYAWAYYNLGRSYGKKDPEKALEYYKKATEKDPDSAYAYNGLGIALLDLGKNDEAIENYEKCIEKDPEFKWAYYNLGISYGKKDPEKAMEYYKKAIEKDADYTDAYNNWGNVLLDLEKPTEAREKFEICLKINPEFKMAYYNLGVSYGKKDPGKAIEYYKKAIEKDPDYTEAYNAIYYNIANIKDKQAYISDFHKLVEEKNSASGYLSLGNIYHHILKDCEKGLFYFEKCKERGGVKNIFLDISQVYDSMGNLEKSIEILDDVLRNDPGDIYALHFKALYLFKMGKYEASRNIWQEVVNKYEVFLERDLAFKNEPNNYLYCGLIYNEIFSCFDKALIKYEIGLAKDKQNIKLQTALYQHFSEVDKLAINPELSNFWKRNTYLIESEKLFNKSLNVEDDYYLMAEIYILEEIYEKAQSMIDYCLEENNPGAKAYILQGQIYTAKEEYVKAIQSFKKALRLEGHNLNIRNNLGIVYFRNKNYSDAESEFNKVLQRDPNNVEALIGLGEIKLNRAEENKDEELLEAAEEYLLKAKKLGNSDKGSKRLNQYEPANRKIERKYKDLQLSELYYSLGYIKVKKYEQNRFDINNSYLDESLTYFTKSFESNPDNLTASIAKNKILRSVQARKKANILEKLGSYLISFLALLIFILCQYFFFFGQNKSNSFYLGKENAIYISSLLSLKGDSSENEIRNLAGIKFTDKNTLIEALKAAVGEDLVAENIGIINDLDYSASNVKPAEDLLSAGYYALISFGSIIFLIAGLYLPQLLKLKVGVIEIEKNAPTEISNITTLGIKREMQTTFNMIHSGVIDLPGYSSSR